MRTDALAAVLETEAYYHGETGEAVFLEASAILRRLGEK